MSGEFHYMILVEDVQKIINDVPKGLLLWYPFQQGKRALYFGNSSDAMTEMLLSQGLEVDCVSRDDVFEKRCNRKYDYIIIIASLEREKHPLSLLQKLKMLLKHDGKMFLGLNNRFGVRFLCGDRDIYTNHVFDGIENYRRAYVNSQDKFHGRCYSYVEICELLKQVGVNSIKFYSVLPDLEHPQMIFSEDVLPNEDLAKRLYPMYHNPDTVYLEEEHLYEDLAKNGLFHMLANTYLIECGNNVELSDVKQVTSSIERGKENAMLTITHGAKYVEKISVYPEGMQRLNRLSDNQNNLIKRGIRAIDGEIINNTYRMPFLEAECVQYRMQRLLLKNKELFLDELDRYVQLVLQAGEVEKEDIGDGNGAILKVGYPDMCFINSFYQDGEYIFFDQEYSIEHCPANMIIYRIILVFYLSDLKLQTIYPKEKLYERYNLSKYLSKWQELERKFIDNVLNNDDLRLYHERYRANSESIYANREKMNYSENDYLKIFVNIFQGLEKRKLIIFGSGKFAKRFAMIYGKEYPIYAVIDNNENAWGKKFGEEFPELVVQSPNVLEELNPDEYKVLICIKNYSSVAKQLDFIGVESYSVYDVGKSYKSNTSNDLKKIETTNTEENIKKEKPYHIGYVAGVFDMFHIGHLNLLKRAKEYCDYLIVGVVPDETVYSLKQKNPIIPCEDRLEIIRSCKYVDRAEALPIGYTSIRDAFKMFRFDVQFSGNDHDDNQAWQADKEYLKKHGADIVYFDYTEKVSSTLLREQIDSKEG